MPDIVRTRVIMFLAGIIFVPLVTVFVILFARGYRPNFQTKELQPTGLLVTHSYPESAQVYVDGQLKTATNATLNLSPGIYSVEIRKEGYTHWIKNLTVEAEIVTRATATLFPSVPTMKPLTAQGAAQPLLSPDGTKVIYTSLDAKNLFLLDLNESPLGQINRDSKLVSRLTSAVNKILWSPDSRQVLAYTVGATTSAYLIDTGNQQTRVVNISDQTITAEWEKTFTTRALQKFNALPEKLQGILATASANIDWSPREDKILYTATASASLSDELKKPLPGSSTQPQERTLRPGSIYVYDLEEDRNFKIGEIALPTPTPKLLKNRNSQISILNSQLSPNAGLHWLPTSSHLIKTEPGKITVFEYDNQNPTDVYSGPLTDQIAIPYPSAKQMLILANLTSTPTPGQPSVPNLYALTLR